jgi:pyruvate formate lyase activating enzyme
MAAQNSIVIGDVEPFSIVDFPNHIAAVAFLQGCPWRCPFCYNTSLQKIGTLSESDWTFEKFFAFLEKRRKVLDGVVFSGGEPLIHDGLAEAVRAVKGLGYAVGLHTGGYAPERLAVVLPFLDWVGLDIKAPLESSRYRQATGVFDQTDRVLKSVDLLLKSGISFECRTTCDPRILSVDDLFLIGQTLLKIGVKEYHLQKYRPVPEDKATTDEQCSALIEHADLLSFLQSSFPTFDVRR